MKNLKNFLCLAFIAYMVIMASSCQNNRHRRSTEWLDAPEQTVEESHDSVIWRASDTIKAAQIQQEQEKNEAKGIIARIYNAGGLALPQGLSIEDIYSEYYMDLREAKALEFAYKNFTGTIYWDGGDIGSPHRFEYRGAVSEFSNNPTAENAAKILKALNNADDVKIAQEMLAARQELLKKGCTYDGLRQYADSDLLDKAGISINDDGITFCYVGSLNPMPKDVTQGESIWPWTETNQLTPQVIATQTDYINAQQAKITAINKEINLLVADGTSPTLKKILEAAKK